MYKEYIDRIANIIAINSQRIAQPGLINGYLGIAVFYYYYARYSKIDQYTVMADNILDFIIDKTMRNMDRSFSNGLYGLGWCLKYLCDNNFIELDERSLEDYHSIALQQYTALDLLNDNSSPVQLFSKGLYCSKINDVQLISSSLLGEEFITSQNSASLNIDFLTSMKYTLINAKRRGIQPELCEQLLCFVEEKLKELLSSGNGSCVERYVLSCFEDAGISNQNYDSQIGLYLSWQSIVYDDFVKIKESITIKELAHHLDSIEMVTPDCLVFGGLSSLGINLIKKSMEK